ncbi:MAG: hypothetical protein HQL57_09475 [Magnetococcales bacterium]|nr:hypothetical protein [Magnetococcales bacterium]
MTTLEHPIEQDLIGKLGEPNYTARPDIRDRAALEANFRVKFEALNRVKLTEGEFVRLLERVSPHPMSSVSWSQWNRIFNFTHSSATG